jgi:hypothetical protein
MGRRMKTLIVSECTRPSLIIQEEILDEEKIEKLNREKEESVVNQDFEKAAQLREQVNKLKIKSQYWTAVEFVTDLKVDEVVGNYEHIRLQLKNNLSEIWEFTQVNIMLHPQWQFVSPYRNKYVLTFDSMFVRSSLGIETNMF